MLAVNVDVAESKERVIAFMKSKAKAKWRTIHEGKGFDGRIALDYMVATIPSAFLIDPDGVLLDSPQGIARLAAHLESLKEEEP